jgi:transcriptional regulator with XRE-family HTH domain
MKKISKELLKKLVRDSGIRQEEFLEITGMTQSYVSRVLNGKITDKEVKQKIADACVKRILSNGKKYKDIL